MIKALLESFLGPTFTAVLHFYTANSLVINSVVVLYGVVMMLSWSNLVRIRRRLASEIASRMLALPGFRETPSMKQALQQVNIPWELVVNGTNFPLVARQTALRPHRCTVAVVQSLLSEEDLARDTLEALSQIDTEVARRVILEE